MQLALYLSAIDNLKKAPAGVLYFPIKNEFAESKQKSLETYKMKGFLLNESDAILDMDTSYSYENPKSNFVYPELKKATKKQQEEGVFEFKQNSGLLSRDEMLSIASYAKAVSAVAVDEILDGYHAASPYKSSSGLSCQYCEYKNICGIITKDYSSAREPALKNAKDFYTGGRLWETK